MYPDPFPRRKTRAPVSVWMCCRYEPLGPSTLSFTLKDGSDWSKPTNILVCTKLCNQHQSTAITVYTNTNFVPPPTADHLSTSPYILPPNTASGTYTPTSQRFLTWGAHANEGKQSCDCVCVCVFERVRV